MSASHTRTKSSLSEFFRYHGLWSPGVRAFRRTSFATKALVITLTFLVPICLLAAFYVQSKLEQIQFGRSELAGVRYVRGVLVTSEQARALRLQTLMAATQPSNAEAAKFQAGKQAVEQAFAALDGLQQGGVSLDTQDNVAAVRKAINNLAIPADGVFKVYATHAKLAHALNDLVNQAADASNLTLDPDLDTYYLMSVSALVLPSLVDSAALMGGLASAAIATGSSAEIVAQELVRLDTTAEALAARLQHDVSRVISVRPDLSDKLSVASLKALTALRDEVSDSPGSGGAERITRVVDLRRTASEGLGRLHGAALGELERLIADRVAGAQRALVASCIAVALPLVVAAYLFYAFFLVMQGGFAELRRHLVAMAQGDLTTEPAPWGKDEAAQLMLSLRDTQQAVRGIVMQVREQSITIVQSSHEIAGGATQLASRAEEAAASIQQSASSIEQVSVTVRNTAEHAGEASTMARDNAAAAQRGGSVMNDVVHTMGQIQESSLRIGEIIGVIDGIAFQTNILALNAAVEAARAGEHGRGFAVVASEVRALAQRSSDAAREIKTLIQDSVDRVTGGTAIVADAGQAISLIVDNAGRINELLDHISRGAAEQSTGISLVGSSVSELDQSTQQNAAMAEQTASVATSLTDCADELMRRVRQFRLPA